MGDTQILEQVNTKIGEFGTTLDSKLADFESKLTPKSEDPEPKAELEQGGVVEGFAKWEFWDIPVGQAVVGGFTAVIASELIDGFMVAQSSMIKGVIKLVGAGAAVKWGSGFLGSTGAKALAILLAYDGIRMLIPIDEWAGRLVSGVGLRTGAGLAGKAGMGNVLSQAEKVTEDYYAGLKG